MDGLSQIDRQQLIDSVKPFVVIDNSMESLLRQAETLATAIRYYDLEGNADGYFDQFFSELKTIRERGGIMSFDRDMEPAQALMYTFLYQLHNITGQFNERWLRYSHWYFNDVLKIASLSPGADSVWISLTKNVPGNVFIKQGTGFTFDAADVENKLFYQSTEDIIVSDITMEKAYSLHFEKNPDIYPASLFQLPTALKMKDLLNDKKTTWMLFEESENTRKAQPLGIRIVSPSLVLREGKRFVSLVFKSESTGIGSISQKKNLVRLIQEMSKRDLYSNYQKGAKEVTLMKIFSTIFYLEISTSEGWSYIDKYTVVVSKNARALTLKFELPENFPETVACNPKLHQTETTYPALRIFANRDSWLFPYSWMKYFLIAKISIQTHVEGINNLLFYNELGKIDNSIPFAPFGINTEKGAWFAVGNYEMALKTIQLANVHIRWQQLPQDDGGLFSYYDGYKNDIDNRSFQLRARYLSDYKWKNTTNTDTLYLFSTEVKDKYGNPESQYKLSDESGLSHILLDKMKPITVAEKDYDYSIRSKSGFFSFVLEHPGMGFGEKRYRQLFSEQMIRKAFKKKKVVLLNPPITPLIERITLSYDSVDEIDLRIYPTTESSSISHIYPLGERLIYPDKENKPQPFVYSLETDANLLFALNNVAGDEFVNLFIDFFPQKKEVSLAELPQIRWYWGDGYNWERLPDGAVSKNTTQNLLTSGFIKIYIPEITGKGFRDDNGLVWLRAGIVQNEQSISEVKNMYVNVVKVKRDQQQSGKERPADFIINSAEYSLPGIAEIKQITPFHKRQQSEDIKNKLIRISEFITHRGKAITVRDYECMTLQKFPEVSKVKCLPNTDTKPEKSDSEKKQGVVTLVIIPETVGESTYYPCADPELLLKIEKYFDNRVSCYVSQVDAINPEYEELLVRCEIEYFRTNNSNADIRATVHKIIDDTIAPWYRKEEPPVFGFSFQLQQLFKRIDEIKWVEKVNRLSVVHLSKRGSKTFRLKEYNDMNDVITATLPYSILVPAQNHIISTAINDRFGIEEMEINENFIIWQNEIETP